MMNLHLTKTCLIEWSEIHEFIEKSPFEKNYVSSKCQENYETNSSHSCLQIVYVD